jgi:hypothetical protein
VSPEAQRQEQANLERRKNLFVEDFVRRGARAIRPIKRGEITSTKLYTECSRSREQHGDGPALYVLSTGCGGLSTAKRRIRWSRTPPSGSR